MKVKNKPYVRMNTGRPQSAQSDQMKTMWTGPQILEQPEAQIRMGLQNPDAVVLTCNHAPGGPGQIQDPGQQKHQIGQLST